MQWVRPLTFLFLALGVLSCVAKDGAQRSDITTTTSQELRAVWASTLSPCMNSPEEIAQLCQAVRRAHLNCVIAQVRHRGITYYRSEIEPPAPSWAGRKDFDPLATLLREAHDVTSASQRLDVYAWFNVFNFGRVEQTSLPQEQRERIRSWLSYTTSGLQTTFLDPAIPEVQEYLLSLIRECVTHYPIDGVNFDFIRYPEEEAGYHPVAIARFQRLYQRSDPPHPNDPQWNEFRRDQVSAFVRRCAAEVWRAKPDAVLTVCAVGFGGAPPNDDFSKASPYRQVHQDWAGWASQGCVDIVTRMGYKREHIPAHAKQFRDWADYSVRLLRQCPGNLITLGIGGYFNSTDNVLVQYREARARAMGTSIFSYWRPEAGAEQSKAYGAENGIWDRLGKEIYPDLASPPRPHWRRDRVTLAVHCRDRETRTPLDGVRIEVKGPVERILPSDGNGWAVFTALPAGNYQIKVAGATEVRKVSSEARGVQTIELTN